MTIGNALTFIKRGMTDEVLRKSLNMSEDMGGLEQILKRENLMFSFHEFDEAFNHRLVQCQEEQEADHLKEFKLWWILLVQMNQGKRVKA